MNEKIIHAAVPGSTANLGPGFDTLGMALNLYAQVEMRFAERLKIELVGDGLEGIPTDESNLVYQVAQMVFKKAGVQIQPLHIAIKSEVPSTRGLGSSAAAIVAGMGAANALIGYPLKDEDLFLMATALEDHPDNVGASLFGGIVVAQWDGKRADYIQIEPHANLQLLAAVPEFHLATEKARECLPKRIDLQDAVYNISHSSLLVAALCSGRLDLLGRAMKDRLHQSQRAALIPGMELIIREAGNYGALSVALSGAGPTLLAFVDKQSTEKKKLEQFMVESFQAASVKADTIWLQPDLKGLRITERQAPELLSTSVT